MPVNVIDVIKPKNNGSFPVVEDVDVKMSDGTRLNAAIESKASKSELNTKADKTNTYTKSEVDNKIASATVDAYTKSESDNKYATKSDLTSKADAAVVAEVQTALESKANKSEVSDLQITIEEKADKSDVSELQSIVSAKADKTETEETTTGLQNQINNIIAPVTQDAELQNLRIGADGTSYPTAKARVDAENRSINDKINSVTSFVDSSPIHYYQNNAVGNSDGRIDYYTTNKWDVTIFDVSANETVEISTTIYGDTFYGAIITDSNRNVIESLFKKGSDIYENITKTIVIPDTAKYIYINRRIDGEHIDVKMKKMKADISGYISDETTSLNKLWSSQKVEDSEIYIKRVMDKMLLYGIKPYSGGLNTINADQTANKDTIYYNSNDDSPSYGIIMLYNGEEWTAFTSNQLTVDKFSEYINNNIGYAVNSLMPALAQKHGAVQAEWEIGNIDGASGEKTDSTNTIRVVNMLPVSLFTAVTISCDKGYTFAIRGYSVNSFGTNSLKLTKPFSTEAAFLFEELAECNYLAFCLRKNGITIEDSSAIHIEYVSSVADVLEKIKQATKDAGAIDDNNTSLTTTWSSTKVNERFVTNENDIAELQNEIGTSVTIKDSVAEKLATVVEYNRNKKFANLMFVTDTHSNVNDAKEAIFTMQSIANTKIMNECIHGGDLITTYGLTYQQYIKEILKYMGNYKRYGEMLFVKGNHDNNHATVVGDNATKYQYHMLMQSHLEHAVFNENDPCACYYYKDCPHEKVRLIILDTFVTEGDSTQVSMDAEQLRWLYETALNVENNWSVIVFAHQFTASDSETVNLSACRNIINAFINKGISYGDYLFPATKTTNFVGVVHGHEHSDSYSNSCGFNVVGVKNAYDANWGFDIITIDTTDKKVKFTRIGSGANRQYNF